MYYDRINNQSKKSVQNNKSTFKEERVDNIVKKLNC